MGTMGSEVRAEIIERITRYGAERLSAEQAALFAPFVEGYYGRTDPEDLESRRVPDLYGMAMSHFGLGRYRRSGEVLLRVFAPDIDEHGFASPHSVVELVVEDMPFLVDSMSMELSRHGYGLHLAIHPVIRVRRNSSGQLEEVMAPNAGGDAVQESYLHIEIDRQTEPALLDELRRDLLRVVADVRAAVEDWSSIQSRALAIADELAQPAGPVSAAERDEAAELLRWLTKGNFIFLGYREYNLVDDGEDELRVCPGTGLGILREASSRPAAHSFADLPPEVRRKARQPIVLNLTKANSRSTVHRRSYLDYIGVKRFDEAGGVVSERRFLGLYTTSVYKQWPQDIPILRRKVATVIDRAGLRAGQPQRQGAGRDPRHATRATSCSRSERRRAVRQLDGDPRAGGPPASAPAGAAGRVRALRVLPRLPAGEPTQRRPRETGQGRSCCAPSAGPSRVHDPGRPRRCWSCLHLVIYTGPAAVPTSTSASSRRSWPPPCGVGRRAVRGARRRSSAKSAASALHRHLRRARSRPRTPMTSPARNAVSDMRRIENLARDRRSLGINLYRPLESSPGALRLKLFRAGRCDHVVRSAPPPREHGTAGRRRAAVRDRVDGDGAAWIYDFGLRSPDPADVDFGQQSATGSTRPSPRSCVGTAENDGFNRLVLARRACGERDVPCCGRTRSYLRQTGTSFGSRLHRDAPSPTIRGIARVARRDVPCPLRPGVQRRRGPGAHLEAARGRDRARPRRRRRT